MKQSTEFLLASPEALEAYRNDVMFHAFVQAVDHAPAPTLEFIGRLIAVSFVAERRQRQAEELKRLQESP
jgi:hypothetical protein